MNKDLCNKGKTLPHQILQHNDIIHCPERPLNPAAARYRRHEAPGPWYSFQLDLELNPNTNPGDTAAWPSFSPRPSVVSKLVNRSDTIKQIL